MESKHSLNGLKTLCQLDYGLKYLVNLGLYHISRANWTNAYTVKGNATNGKQKTWISCG